MAHVISITDGATTITFTQANGYQVLAYDMVTPESSGGKLADDVAETLEVIVSGADGAQVQTRIGALSRLLDSARRRTAWGVGPRVFLQLRVDGEPNTWRTELYDAAMTPQEDTLRLWPNFAPTFDITIRRAAVWEGALAQIPLTNVGGSANTTGLNVYLHDDTGRDNYVEIAADGVGGNLPTPLHLELTNNNGATVQLARLYMGCNAFSDPANLPPTLQAETIRATGGSVVAGDSSCSNDGYVAHTFTNSAVQQYTLSAALLRAARGYDFHLLARFRSLTGAAYVRPYIYDSTGVYPLWMGAEVEIAPTSPSVVDLGVIPLPPGGYTTLAGALRLYLAWRTTGTISVESDCFVLLPANTFRLLQIQGPVPANAIVVDNGPEAKAFVRSGTSELPFVAPQGLPLTVWPGLAQRIYFTWNLLDGSAPVTQTLSVKAWHRPRRLSF